VTVYPRPVRSIHQIEVTTRCNLRCVYCPSPIQPQLRNQAPMDMTRATFERALEWAVALNDRRDDERGELSLTGVGEALLHPEFVDFVRLAREALPGNPLVFSTNGLLLTDELCAKLAPYRPKVFVSLHRPEKAAHAIHAAKKAGILAGHNAEPGVSPFNWAGQVPGWPNLTPPRQCEFLRAGWAVVLVDGRITTCCLDASGAGVIGHVDDPIESLTKNGTGLKPWGNEKMGCSACHMIVP